MVSKKLFDNYKGNDITLFTLSGDGIEVGVTDFGAALQYLRVTTRSGVKDIVLGYPTIGARLASGTYCGAAIGRTANRIKDSTFTLQGKTYTVTANEGANSNHGGKEGFDSRLFKGEICNDGVEFTLFSPDGDQGYPGNLTFKVYYCLQGSTLTVRLSAECDKDTLWAPTCHPYFNLNGEESGRITQTFVKIDSNAITPADLANVTTGEVWPVPGTVFDFRKFVSLEERIEKSGGLDVNFLMNGPCSASAYSTASGIRLDVSSDMPALQLYTGRFLRGRGKSGDYGAFGGFCLEPQFVPNAVNLQGFAVPVLKAGTPAGHYISYKITADN